jgi:hypothetical protein
MERADARRHDVITKSYDQVSLCFFSPAPSRGRSPSRLATPRPWTSEHLHGREQAVRRFDVGQLSVPSELAECDADQYLAGVSVNLGDGQVHRLLCCNNNP